MKWTVLLLRPESRAATYGHDTFCAHVTGDSPKEALHDAREAACEADDHDTPEDYWCLFCAKGHLQDYQDGHGGAG